MRNMATLSFEVPMDMKEEIKNLVRDLHFHSSSELIRTGVRKVLDEIKVKKQVAEQTGNAPLRQM